MNHLNSGLLSTYNSLTDKHLAGYFNNTRIRRHLQRAGLITRSGRIVPDKEYRLKMIHQDHQRHMRECLAHAVFQKVIDMERHHQVEIKRKLEDFAQRERLHKIKVEQTKRYNEDIVPSLSQRPPTGPRNGYKQHSGPGPEPSEYSESPTASRPNTAPGKMQRPLRLQPIHSNSTTASIQRAFPRHRHRDSSDDTEQQFTCTLDKDTMRTLTITEFSSGIYPYRLPVINNYVTPAPPTVKRSFKGTTNRVIRGRRLRPTTAPSVPALVQQDFKFQKTLLRSNVLVTMVFYGRTIHLSHDDMDMRHEVKVFQQHCGGENLCVYKGKLMAGEAFQFVSRRHHGFPFSLNFFLNDLQVDRMSSCCEFKHRKGSRLGGKHGHFGFSSMGGASPCYKCIIAMGLDKKPTPPPKRIKEDIGTYTSWTQQMASEAKQVEGEDNKPDSHSHIEPEPVNKQAEDHTVEREAKNNIAKVEEDKAKYDYEEDFEADYKTMDETMEEAKVVNGMVRSSSNNGRYSQTKNKEDGERDIRESEVDGKGTYSDIDFEEDDKTDSSKEDSEGDAEEVKENMKEEKAAEDTTGQTEGVEGTSLPLTEKDQQSFEEQSEAGDDSNIETSSPAPPQTIMTAEGGAETHESPGGSTEKTELELLDSSKQPEKRTDKRTICAAVDKCGNAAKTEEELSSVTKPERGSWLELIFHLLHISVFSLCLTKAKSMQEKLVEAILKGCQCSSEPEFSDTSTEEVEEFSKETKTMEENKTGVEREDADISSLQPPANTEECSVETKIISVDKAAGEHPATNKGEVCASEKEQEVGGKPESGLDPGLPTEDSVKMSEPQTNQKMYIVEVGVKADANEIDSQEKDMKTGEKLEAGEAQSQKSVTDARVDKQVKAEENNADRSEPEAEETDSKADQSIRVVKAHSSTVAKETFTTEESAVAEIKKQDAEGKEEETERKVKVTKRQAEKITANITKNIAERQDTGEEQLKTREGLTEKSEDELEGQNDKTIDTNEKAADNNTLTTAEGTKDKGNGEKELETEGKEAHAEEEKGKAQGEIANVKMKKNTDENNDIAINAFQKNKMERKNCEAQAEEMNEFTGAKDKTKAKSQVVSKDVENETESKSRVEIKQEDIEICHKTEIKLEENDETDKDAENGLNEWEEITEMKSEEKDENKVETVRPAGDVDSKVQEVELNSEKQEVKLDNIVGVKEENGTKENIMVYGESGVDGESSVSDEDKHVNRVVEETEAKCEVMEENQQTAFITGVGESTFEEANRQARVELEKGEKEACIFEICSKEDKNEEQAVTEGEGSKSNPLELELDVISTTALETKTLAEELRVETEQSIPVERDGKRDYFDHKDNVVNPTRAGKECKIQKSEVLKEQKQEEDNTLSMNEEKVTEIKMQKSRSSIEDKDDAGGKANKGEIDIVAEAKLPLILCVDYRKDPGATDVVVVEDAEKMSNLLPKGQSRDQNSTASNSSLNIAPSTEIDRVDENVTMVEDSQNDEVKTEQSSECPFDCTKEIANTSKVDSDKVVHISIEGGDNGVEHVVKENGKSSQKKIKLDDPGGVADAITTSKSPELQLAEQVVDLEHERDVSLGEAGTSEPKMKSEAEEDVVTPEAMMKVDSRDLVSTWISKHQALRCFQTFTETLDLNNLSVYERRQPSDDVRGTMYVTKLSDSDPEKISEATEKNTDANTTVLVQDVHFQGKADCHTGNSKVDLEARAAFESDSKLENINMEGDHWRSVSGQENIEEMLTKSNISKDNVLTGYEPFEKLSQEKQAQFPIIKTEEKI
ncbi:glutamate-rich protein 3 [Megalops cyprinoides]|uniref:glutamate-rich protein 3 n=1 Tax=Megalops cyprinoides TaxID=118141 RepID=UPI001864B0F5|nr:glutamate-rich protein 3 [Megalops cyprinoides]